MRASFRWLQELLPLDEPVEAVAERLTAGGIEVEALTRCGEGLGGVVIAEVRAKRPHTKRDNLTLVTVFDGQREHEVVCGAPNVPEAGGRVLYARLGASLPNGISIEPRKIGGVVSEGMICSEVELDIGADAEGIVVLDRGTEGRPGQLVREALDLDDVILELGLTPNRPDALGHIGLARELGLLFGVDFALPKTEPLSNDAKPPVAITIADGDRCPRYGAALVTGLTVGPSPFWVKYRLHNLGLRSISNVVDATNLILLESGHPIHGFDLKRVRGAKIDVRLASEGEKMATLDDVERTFTADDLLICDGEGPVAVAGVMGGADSEIRDETTEVLIECAYFNPRSIRRTARRLLLATDSSHRFERGVDPNGVPYVLARSAALLAVLGGGTVQPVIIDVVAHRSERKALTLRHRQVARLLGVGVDPAESKQILERVGCEVVDQTQDKLDVLAPTWRPDLGREADLIEEVARVRGYPLIPTELPHVRPSETGTPEPVRFVERLRDSAAAAGLREAINFSFLAKSELEQARVSTATVSLANPLSEDRSEMRTSLLPGLAHAASNALRRQVFTVALFELGRTFHRPSDPLPIEHTELGVILAGARPGWIGQSDPFDFYDGKGVLEALLRPVLGRAPEFALSDALDTRAPYLHPKRRAGVTVGDHDLGAVGELHPDVAEAFDLPGRAVVAVLDVERVHAAAIEAGVPQAHALPRYPAVIRDIAMLVGDSYPAGQIAQALKEGAGGLAESVTIFDLYTGDQVPVGKRSLAFRVVYRDLEETLTDKRVDKVHAKLAKIAESRFDAKIR